MVQKHLLNLYPARTAGMLSGARQGAMMLVATLLFTLTAQTAWATIGGTGTKYDPYTINSLDDWNTFAGNISNGTELYEGKYVKLAADIDGITTMAGEYDNINKEFRGTFDGGGHTLTLNIADYLDNVAPFRRVNGATIKNLHIAGTVSSTNSSAPVQYMTGLIARSYGNVTISNCRSSVDIRDNYSSSKDASHGGFIAVVESGTVTISNCLFDGSINDANATNCGGFIGWHGDDQQVTFNNCLMAGTLNINVNDGNSATFSRNGSKMTTLNNCYYVTSYGAVQGTLVGEGSNTATPENLAAALNNGGEEWQVVSSKVVPVMVQNPNNIQYATVAGLKKTYQYDSGNPIAINFTVTNVEGTLLSTPTDYTVTIKNSANETVASVTDKGVYTLTVAGTGSKTSGYYGSQVFTFRVADAIDLSEITANYTATNGEKLTGTLGANVKITIAAGATITLNGVTINGVNNDKYPWAGLTCEGNATIILADVTTNTVKGFHSYYPGIYVPENYTLTIQGSTGKLNVSSNGDAPGIGACYYGPYSGTPNACGNIVIEGGDITAVSSTRGAGIGGGYKSSCGDITISGGNVTATGAYEYSGIGGGIDSTCGNITISGTANVTATGGYEAAGIGSGFWDGHCGNITISTTGTVIATSGGFGAGIGGGSTNNLSHISTCGNILITNGHITATGGLYAAGIGSGNDSTCGNITIQGGNITATGGQYGAGIGSSQGNGNRNFNRCGTITISGGTVSATGGNGAAGIGTGWSGTCGSISITADVTNVTAIKGEGSPNSIGCGKDETGVPSKILDAGDVDGTITIDANLYDSGEGSASRTIHPYNVLSDVSDLNDAIKSNIAGQTVTFTRTFTSGVASTICLPFDYTPGTEGTYYTFSGVSQDTYGNWTATMSETAATLTANTPYLFVPAAGGDVPFSGTCATTISASSTDVTDWSFVGTYAAKTWTSDASDANDYGFAAQNGTAANDNTKAVNAGDFVHLTTGASIKPFRAYLHFGGSTLPWSAASRATRSGEAGLPRTISVVLVSANGNTTEIGTLDTRTGEIIPTGEWYSLDGRRLQGKPSTKGVYVNNSKKIMIK